LIGTIRLNWCWFLGGFWFVFPRKDYTVSPYLIHTTELSFRLDEHETIVSSKIDFYQNTLSADKSGNLFLNGIDLELISINCFMLV
jgi:hypothetical protein